MNEDKIRETCMTDPEQGFRMLVTKYQSTIYWHIRRMIVSHEDAEDVLQETFIKIFRHLGDFRAECSLSTWIYRIATNTALSAIRKRKNEVIRLDDSVFANLSDTQVDEALEDDSEEQLQRLQRAMEQLEADERALITLYYMEEKPLAEVAFIMRLTEANVKVKLHRIRKKLYIFIKNQE